MIVIGRSFPKPEQGVDLDRPCPLFGWPTAVLRAIAKQDDYVDHQTAFTIVSNFGGSAYYRSKGKETRLDEGKHLVFYPGERFSSFVDAKKPVESVYIVFRDADIAAALSRDDLNEDPGPAEVSSLPRSIGEASHISRIRDLVRSNASEAVIEEALLSMLHCVARDHWGTIDRRMRPATVIERRARLERARERMHAEPAAMTLDTMAETACLSNFHFLRLFTETFGTTPHKYLTELRLERARELLTSTTESIERVASRVGFASSTTFGNTFKRRFGHSPGVMRQSE